jgi:hypothetical protein
MESEVLPNIEHRRKVVKQDPLEAARMEREKVVNTIATSPTILEAATKLFAKSRAWGDKVGVIDKPVVITTTKAIEMGKIIDECFKNYNQDVANYLRRLFEIEIGEEIPTSSTPVGKVKFEEGIVVMSIKKLPGAAAHNYPLNTPLFIISGPSMLAVPTEAGKPQNHLDNTAVNLKIPTVQEIAVGLAEFYMRDMPYCTKFMSDFAV